MQRYKGTECRGVRCRDAAVQRWAEVPPTQVQGKGQYKNERHVYPYFTCISNEVHVCIMYDTAHTSLSRKEVTLKRMKCPWRKMEQSDV
jgi:hypothetical protein